MSLRLFLDHVVHNAVVPTLADAEPSAKADYYGVPIRLDVTGRPYYEVRDEDATWQTMIPDPLMDHVAYVSWWLRLPADCTVANGRYGYQTAGVIVTDDHHRDGLRAQFYGPDLHDVYILRYWLPVGRAEVLEQWQVPESSVQPADFLEQFVGEALEARAFTPCTRTDNALKFVCGQCNAKFQIAADKIAGRIIKMHCRKCGESIQLDGRPYAEASSQGTDDPPEPPPAN